MPRIRDVYQYEPQDKDFLTHDEKEALVESGKTFNILGIDEDMGTHGPMWVLLIQIEGDPNTRKLSFSMANWRDAMISPMRDAINETNEPYEAVKLVHFKSRSGQQGYSLADSDE